MTGGNGKQGRPPAPADRTPEVAGTVEQRVERWATMLDDAVKLLNQVMTEVKETGHQDDD